MAELILSIINEGLPILDKIVPDQATVIRNKILKYRSDWDEEISKGSNRDDAMLDCIELQLHDICQLFASALKQTSSSIKP